MCKRLPNPEDPPSQRGRSLLFIAYGLLAATTTSTFFAGDAVKLFVCENGFISINPPLTGLRLLLSGSDSKIRTSIGLHPQLARERRSELHLIDSHITKTKYVGEIGLDGSPECKSSWTDQIAVFEYILSKCSESGGRIMSLHSRRATSAVLDCLEQFPNAGTPVLHWFTGNRRELGRAIDLGCWFSIGPAMLSNERGRNLAQMIPKDRILTESDGPFAQVDGQTLMPWDVHRATELLSTIWGMSERAADTQLLDNLRSLTTFPATG